MRDRKQVEIGNRCQCDTRVEGYRSATRIKLSTLQGRCCGGMCDVSGDFLATPSEFLSGVLFISFQLGADSPIEKAIFAENRSCWANWHRFCQCVITGQLIRELQFVFG